MFTSLNIPNQFTHSISVCLASVLLCSMSLPAVSSDNNKTYNACDGNPFMEEVIAKPESEDLGWQSIYKAYSCVYHKKWALTSHWLMFSLKQGAGDQLLQSRVNLTYLCRGLSNVATERQEVAVPESSCEAQILQAFIQSLVGSQEEAIDSFKRVVLNNPTYPSIKYLKQKIREMEFEKSGSPWMTPPDVVQTGGKSNRYSKWKSDKFPLKVYIPPDKVSSKVAGYRTGDNQLLRSAFDTWQKLSNGKIRFVYEPIKTNACITCSWVSDQKKLDTESEDAVGVCWRWADGRNYLQRAKIQILTLSTSRKTISASYNQFRKNYLEHVCLHEIGHSLGLNHSSSDKDIMHAYIQKPVGKPTKRDVVALHSAYSTNMYEFISTALNAISSGNYKTAFAQLDRALMANPGDSQTRDAICVYLSNAATDAMQNSDYKTAIKLLIKSRDLASSSSSAEIKKQVLKNLHYAYLQAGKSENASALENEDNSLKTTDLTSAAFLDKYGLNRESLPHYEEALAKDPNNLAIREKFCFLLVLLGRDELHKNNDDKAISLLVRAKSLLCRGMSEQIIDKVFANLHHAYEYTQRYSEADQLYKEVKALKPPPPAVKKRTAAEDIADLVAIAKKRHPKAWATPALEKSQHARVKLAYEQYTEALRKFARAAHMKPEPNWAAVLIARRKPNYRKKGPNPLASVYNLRNQLIALTDANAVINIECGLPF